jgi:hypothetical protein
MKMRIPATLSVAVVGGAVLASAVPAVAAVTGQSPVTTHSPVTKHSPASSLALRIDHPAALSPEGTVLVSTQVSCPTDSYYAYVFVSVTQPVGGYLVQGDGWQYITCTGGKQTIKLAVRSYYKNFTTGKASASAYLGAASPNGFISTSAIGALGISK